MRMSRKLDGSITLDSAFPPAPHRAPIRLDDVFREAKSRNILDLRGIGALLRPVNATARIRIPQNFALRDKRAAPVPVLPAPRQFPLAAEGSRRQNVALPYGITRFLRASVLKRIAGGRITDQLLRRTPSGQWAFVDNSEVIDLSDATQVFKLGKLAIFS